MKLSKSQLENYALKLGSDCPFFIDNTPKYVQGIGEKMTAIDLDLSDYEIRLVNPEIYISTKEAYDRVVPRIAKTDLLDLISQPIESWKSDVENDFEVSAFTKHPQLKRIKNQIAPRTEGDLKDEQADEEWYRNFADEIANQDFTHGPRS